MKPPDTVPELVIDAIARRHVHWVHTGHARRHCYSDRPWEDPDWVPVMKRFEEILKGLKWNFDHYCFDFAGMYVGVELDGYMHT